MDNNENISNQEKELKQIQEMLEFLTDNNGLACDCNCNCNCYAVAGVRG